MRHRGFTLIELIVTIGILGILLAAAAPSVRDMILNNRMTSITNDMLSDLAVARSEAAKRGQRIVICKNATGAGADTTCDNASEWKHGWLLYVDADNDGTLDVGETIVRVRQAFPAEMSIIPGGAIVDTLTMRPIGTVTPLGGFKLCDQRVGLTGRTITVTASGRANVAVVACP